MNTNTENPRLDKIANMFERREFEKDVLAARELRRAMQEQKNSERTITLPRPRPQEELKSHKAK